MQTREINLSQETTEWILGNNKKSYKMMRIIFQHNIKIQKPNTRFIKRSTWLTKRIRKKMLYLLIFLLRGKNMSEFDNQCNIPLVKLSLLNDVYKSCISQFHSLCVCSLHGEPQTRNGHAESGWVSRLVTQQSLLYVPEVHTGSNSVLSNHSYTLEY